MTNVVGCCGSDALRLQCLFWVQISWFLMFCFETPKSQKSSHLKTMILKVWTLHKSLMLSQNFNDFIYFLETGPGERFKGVLLPILLPLVAFEVVSPEITQVKPAEDEQLTFEGTRRGQCKTNINKKWKHVKMYSKIGYTLSKLNTGNTHQRILTCASTDTCTINWQSYKDTWMVGASMIS